MSMLDKLFGGKKPEAQRGEAPPSTPSAPVADGPLAAFALGANVEEIYCIFGEQIQTGIGGLPHQLFAVAQRKLTSVDATLAAFGVDAAVRQAFSSVKGRLERQDPSAAPELAIAASQEFASQISAQMGSIRRQIGDVRGTQYDAGIFCARLALCARIIRTSFTSGGEMAAKMREIYSKEIGRAGQTLGQILAKSAQSGWLEKAFDREWIAVLMEVAVTAGEGRGATADGARAIESKIERLLAQAGFKAAG
jgi:hypothetical protein